MVFGRNLLSKICQYGESKGWKAATAFLSRVWLSLPSSSSDFRILIFIHIGVTIKGWLATLIIRKNEFWISWTNLHKLARLSVGRVSWETSCVTEFKSWQVCLTSCLTWWILLNWNSCCISLNCFNWTWSSMTQRNYNWNGNSNTKKYAIITEIFDKEISQH